MLRSVEVFVVDRQVHKAAQIVRAAEHPAPRQPNDRPAGSREQPGRIAHPYSSPTRTAISKAPVARDKFAHLDRPEMPSPISAWQLALAAVDRGRRPLSTLFPEPALLATPGDPKSRQVALHHDFIDEILGPAMRACGLSQLHDFPSGLCLNRSHRDNSRKGNRMETRGIGVPLRTPFVGSPCLDQAIHHSKQRERIRTPKRGRESCYKRRPWRRRLNFHVCAWVLKVQHGYPEVDPDPDPTIPYPAMDPTRKPARVTRGSSPTRGSLRVLCRMPQEKYFLDAVCQTIDANHFHQGLTGVGNLGSIRNQQLVTKRIIGRPAAGARPKLPSTREDPRVLPCGSRYCAGRRKANPYPDPHCPRVRNRGYTRFGRNHTRVKPYGSSTKQPKKQFRAETGLDIYKREQSKTINSERDKRISAGNDAKPLVVWNGAAKNMYSELAPEEKAQWDGVAAACNEIRKKGPTPEEAAASIVQ
ncbi:hypothetical protein R3P38DRAFT_3288359 [Favolaschia claudopus]|uniref:Uncharacterized protein n=1 Tax=Favolaschia claudopus TaxID=2862362 RepID=A0AAV9ZWD5_9AGAR